MRCAGIADPCGCPEPAESAGAGAGGCSDPSQARLILGDSCVTRDGPNATVSASRFGHVCTTHTQPQLQDSLMTPLGGPPARNLCAPAHAQSSRLHSCAFATFIPSSPREPPQNLEDYWASLTAWQCWAGSEAPGPGSAGLTTVPTRYSLYIACMVKLLHAHCTRRCKVNWHDR